MSDITKDIIIGTATYIIGGILLELVLSSKFVKNKMDKFKAYNMSK